PLHADELGQNRLQRLDVPTVSHRLDEEIVQSLANAEHRQLTPGSRLGRPQPLRAKLDHVLLMLQGEPVETMRSQRQVVRCAVERGEGRLTEQLDRYEAGQVFVRREKSRLREARQVGYD